MSAPGLDIGTVSMSPGTGTTDSPREYLSGGLLPRKLPAGDAVDGGPGQAIRPGPTPLTPCWKDWCRRVRRGRDGVPTSVTWLYAAYWPGRLQALRRCRCRCQYR